MKEIIATKNFYNKNGAPWINLKTNSFYNEEAFIKLIKILPKKGKVLDIGCAAGVHVPMFLGLGRHLDYRGIDISSFFIKIARRRYPQLQFDIADINNKKMLPKEKFIGFFSGSTIQHIPFPAWPQTFSNIETLMTTKAVGFLSLPIENPKSVQDRIGDNRHMTILTESEQVQFFKERGYKIIHRGRHNGYAKEDIWRWYIIQLP